MAGSAGRDDLAGIIGFSRQPCAAYGLRFRRVRGAFGANYPAKVGIAGDAGAVLTQLLAAIEAKLPRRTADAALRGQIAKDKAAYRESWYRHDAADLVNPVRFLD